MRLENKNMNLSWCRDLVGEFSGRENESENERGSGDENGKVCGCVLSMHKGAGICKMG